MSDNPRQSLAEDALFAETVLTAEAARVKLQADCDAMPGEIGDVAGVAAVDTFRVPVAVRA
jgi:hypothetical protein